ncbi:MAG TPA: hypothetical protein VMW15_05425 [Terracidiphilus sp.]|nr:hypothetical protein [Terracidiphilus sp.]
MRKLLYVCAALVLALGASKVHAADVTGSWKGQVSTPDGGNITLAYTFKQDGAKLTGSSQGPMGDAVEITDGKVDGNKISFTTSFNGMTMTSEGTLSESGDEIKLSTKSDDGDFPGMEVTLKRDK